MKSAIEIMEWDWYDFYKPFIDLNSDIMPNSEPLKNYILIAEDDEDDRATLQEIIDELPLSVKTRIVEDGFELLNFLETPGINLPNLILLDINMPLINGLECLETIKNNAHLKSIPVIMCSVADDQALIEKCYNLGAKYYVIKPNSFPELKQTMKKILETNWVEDSVKK
jgi:CheY-like chemotaxis protein